MPKAYSSMQILLLIVCFDSEYKGPPSAASSAKQSPALQHRTMKSSTQEERYQNSHLNNIEYNLHGMLAKIFIKYCFKVYYIM